MISIYEYGGRLYPDYLKRGNAMRFVEPFAREFCVGNGLDIGAGKWPLPGAIPIEINDGARAEALPEGKFDYIFSSHCLEHLADPIGALCHWKTRLVPRGTLFVYLPHKSMSYWLPQNCRKHLHAWEPREMTKIFYDLGFAPVLHSERDLAWGFCVVGFVPESRET